MTPLSLALLGVACLYGVIAGLNDGGNMLASLNAGRVIGRKSALALLLLMPLGPILLGSQVARTVSSRIIDFPAQGDLGFILITVVAVAVVLFSWRSRIPTSMTLALVGSMVGWVLVAPTQRGVTWPNVVQVVAGMLAAVVGGALLAGLVFSVAHRILGRLAHARVLSLTRLQFITGGFQSFAYGANDLEKTIGLVVVAQGLHGIRGQGFDGAFSIAAAMISFLIGAMAGGWRLARRVGFGIARITPLQSLSVQLAAGTMVSFLAIYGFPVSMTQTTDGAIIGAGAAIRASAVRWQVVREMMTSWLITLPLALILAMVIHLLLRAVVGR